MLRIGFLLFLCLLQGCATVYTVSHAEKGVKLEGTYCGELPHIMSGTSYNICTMHGEPGDMRGVNTENRLAALAVDSVLSLVADIVVSPLTFYNALTKPPISINSAAKS